MMGQLGKGRDRWVIDSRACAGSRFQNEKRSAGVPFISLCATGSSSVAEQNLSKVTELVHAQFFRPKPDFAGEKEQAERKKEKSAFEPKIKLSAGRVVESTGATVQLHSRCFAGRRDLARSRPTFAEKGYQQGGEGLCRRACRAVAT